MHQYMLNVVSKDGNNETISFQNIEIYIGVPPSTFLPLKIRYETLENGVLLLKTHGKRFKNGRNLVYFPLKIIEPVRVPTRYFNIIAIHVCRVFSLNMKLVLEPAQYKRVIYITLRYTHFQVFKV